MDSLVVLAWHSYFVLSLIFEIFATPSFIPNLPFHPRWPSLCWRKSWKNATDSTILLCSLIPWCILHFCKGCIITSTSFCKPCSGGWKLTIGTMLGLLISNLCNQESSAIISSLALDLGLSFSSRVHQACFGNALAAHFQLRSSRPMELDWSLSGFWRRRNSDKLWHRYDIAASLKHIVLFWLSALVKTSTNVSMRRKCVRGLSIVM